MIGQRVAKEALGRGHQVTAVARDPARAQRIDPRLVTVRGDVLDAKSIADAVRGTDAVVSAVGRGQGPNRGPDSLYVQAARALIAIALVDELERPRNVRRRMTLGY